jgi:hypothetical protein
MTGLDSRLTIWGLGITVAQLVTLWADHYPANLPVPLACPTCGHPYSAKQPLCPTATVVRPLLHKRRYEGHTNAFNALTYLQGVDLFGKKLATAELGDQPTTLPVTTGEPPELFDATAFRITRAGGRL